MAHRALSGALLVGGASLRFGSPKALAVVDGETLAERGWRLLEEACDEVLVVGKQGELPFEVIDDGSDVRAPIAGVVAGLRAASNDVVVFVPVDCPHMTVEVVQQLGSACEGVDAAVSQTGPLPGAWSKSALPVLERRLAAGPYALYRAYDELTIKVVELDPALLADVDTPDELSRNPGSAAQPG